MRGLPRISRCALIRATSERRPPAWRQYDHAVAVEGDQLVHHRVLPHADARAAPPRLAHVRAPARTLAHPGEELKHDQADRLGHGAPDYHECVSGDPSRTTLDDGSHAAQYGLRPIAPYFPNSLSVAVIRPMVGLAPQYSPSFLALATNFSVSMIGGSFSSL